MKDLKKPYLWAVILIVALLIALGVTGWNRQKNREAGDQAGMVSKIPLDARKQTLIVASGSETPSLTATDHNAQVGAATNLLLYNTLVKYDKDLKIVPDLAESYENTSETEWLFHLHKGVLFHDGEEMTAADVVASISHAQQSPEVSLYTTAIQKIEALNSYTVKITTNGPSASLLDQLCHHGNAVLPRKLLEEGNNFNKNPVGTGPYRFLNWFPGDRIELQAFEDYFDTEHRAQLKYLVWRVIPDGSSRTIALQNGEVDYLMDVEGADVDRLKEDLGTVVGQIPSTAQTYLMLNNTLPGLDQVAVRRAIYCAVDRSKALTAALNGLGSVAFAQAPVNLEGATTEGCDAYDPQFAQSLLDSSGIDASKLKLSIICSNSSKKRAAESIQEDLGKIGISCDIETLDLATYLATTSEGNYSAAIGGYSVGDMISYLTGVFHSRSITATNRSRLNNAMVDMLIDQAAGTLDEAQRVELLHRCNRLINTLCPQVPLYQEAIVQAYAADLKGVQLSPMGRGYLNEIYREK